MRLGLSRSTYQELHRSMVEIRKHTVLEAESEVRLLVLSN